MVNQLFFFLKTSTSVLIFFNISISYANSKSCNNFLSQSSNGYNSSIVLNETLFSNVLSEEEHFALEQYKDSGHWEINKIQRSRLGRILIKYNSAHCQDCILLNSALSKLPNYKGVVYRGARNLTPQVKKTLISKGNTFADYGFMSTSREFSHAAPTKGENSVFMVILSKTGKSIENVNQAYKQEKEVIFLPGTKFFISNVDKNEDGSHTVYLSEI